MQKNKQTDHWCNYVLKEGLGINFHKMIRCHEPIQVYEAKRLERSCLILRHIAEGTLSSLAITDEKKFDVKQQTTDRND